VGTVGDSHDNALTDTMIGLFKAAMIHRLDRCRSADVVEWQSHEWGDWFNTRELPEPIGYITPAAAKWHFLRKAELGAGCLECVV
jgi:putative transposase